MAPPAAALSTVQPDSETCMLRGTVDECGGTPGRWCRCVFGSYAILSPASGRHQPVSGGVSELGQLTLGYRCRLLFLSIPVPPGWHVRRCRLGPPPLKLSRPIVLAMGPKRCGKTRQTHERLIPICICRAPARRRRLSVATRTWRGAAGGPERAEKPGAPADASAGDDLPGRGRRGNPGKALYRG